MSTKLCSSCKIEKSVSDYYIRKDTGRYKNRCKRCCIEGINIVKSGTHKVCKHCNIEKPFSEFQKAGKGKWLQPYCKPCDKIRKQKHYESNRENAIQKRKNYYYENRVLVSAERKAEAKKFVTNKLREGCIKYWGVVKMSPEERRVKKYECDKKYRENNHDKIKAAKKAYYDLKGNEQSKKWQKIMMNDVGFRIKKNLRGRIYVALKRGIKSESTIKLLGCTIENFKKYFESLFTDGMSWEKYLQGGIHIDHKIPCKNFDLTKPEDQRKCFHYTNLQPLWELDNLRKGVSLNYTKK